MSAAHYEDEPPTRINWSTEPRLGQIPDSELAQILGVDVFRVRSARQQRGLPAVRAYTRRANSHDWDSDPRLGQMPDQELAALLGLTASAVWWARKERGIESVQSHRPMRRKASVATSDRLSIEEMREGAELVEDDTWTGRPRTRGECAAGIRPCPWVSCRHHLAAEVAETLNGRGSLRLVYGHGDISALRETCSLDVADRGDHTLEEVADVLGVTKERVRQEEDHAIAKAQRRLRGQVATDWFGDDCGDDGEVDA